MIRYGVLLLSVVGLGPDSVTFDLAEYRDVRDAPVLVFSGTISSGAGGEYVEVLGRECRSRGERLISGVLTSGGGGRSPGACRRRRRWPGSAARAPGSCI